MKSAFSFEGLRETAVHMCGVAPYSIQLSGRVSYPQGFAQMTKGPLGQNSLNYIELSLHSGTRATDMQTGREEQLLMAF